MPPSEPAATQLRIGQKLSKLWGHPPDRWRGGGFLRGGTAFPSGHATSTWPLASVVSQQYRLRRWAPFVACGAATVIRTPRVTGDGHFPSDVLVGSTMGWLVDHHVVNGGVSAAVDNNLHWKPGILPVFGPHETKWVSLLWSR
ncbi:MAG: phosphatase PAP2 family protein [Acidobacteriota bacterium]